jgi:hypothetical protein
MNENPINTQPQNPQSLDPQSLNLRDIHLPDPISWWPISAGWWMLLAALVLSIIIIFVLRKIYKSRQLNRDINSEIDHIKKQFSQDQDKSQLAKSLSILLRRASISFYPARDIAGLTGDNWLAMLDQSNKKPVAELCFQSDIGRLLISAPYQSADSLNDYDDAALIRLCKSWLLSKHDKTLPQKHKVIQP